MNWLTRSTAWQALSRYAQTPVGNRMMFVYFGLLCLAISTIVCVWADNKGLDATLPVVMLLFGAVSGIGFGALPILPRLFWRYAFGKNWTENIKTKSDSESSLVLGLPSLCLGIFLLAIGISLLLDPYKIDPSPALFSLTVVSLTCLWLGGVIGIVIGLEVLLARRACNRQYGPDWPDGTSTERR